MSRLQTLQDFGMAWALALGLLALGAALDDAENAMNLNTPAIEQGPLTADDLAAWRAAHEPRCCTHDHRCNQGRQCPMRAPAEASTEVGHTEPRGKHREGWLTGLWLRLVRALT